MQPIPPPPPYPPPYPYPYPPPPPRKTNVALIVVLCVVGGVVVLGILAAVAIPQFMHYAKKQKTSKAELELQYLYKAVRSYAVENGALPATSAGPVPATPCCEQAERRCQPDPLQWQEEPWLSLGFSVDDQSYFQYSYEVDPSGQRFTLRATGDLDCDGISVDYTLTGGLRDGVVEGGEVTRPANDD